MTKAIKKQVLGIVVKEQRLRDKDDLKKQLHPLYDIEQNVHKDTLKDLLELHEAIASVSGEKATDLTLAKVREEIKQRMNLLEKAGMKVVGVGDYHPAYQELKELLSKLGGDVK